MNQKLDEIAGLPFGEIIHVMLRRMGSLGNVPGQPVPITDYISALRARIQSSSHEVLGAKAKNDIEAVNLKLDLLRNEERKIIDKVKITAIEGMLRGEYGCLAYLDGQKVVVPSAHFSGDVDWDEETLQFAGKRYTRLRLINTGQLSPDLVEFIRRCMSENVAPESNQSQPTPPASTGAPGRPSSMHLVELEFERRAKEKLTASTLKMESETLAQWLKDTHPCAPKATSKTIKNRIRHTYNALKSKQSLEPE